MDRDDVAAPFERILVPLGRGSDIDRGLAVAHQLALRAGVPVRTLRVAMPLAVPARGDRLVTSGRSRSLRAVEATEVVGYGSVAEAIAGAAGPGTLVCMSSHGAYGPARTLAGGITDAVLRTSAVPLLLVGPHVASGAAFDHGRVVACIDESPFSERAVWSARVWSRAFDLPFWLVQVVPPGGSTVRRSTEHAGRSDRRLDELARAIPDIDGWRVLHDRHPSRALAAAAETDPVAILVMATHARTGWSRVLAGSVTASVVRRAAVPVLVVPGPSDG